MKRVGTVLTLFFFAGIATFGCREGATNESPPILRPIVLSFTSGDRFIYDGWTVDEFGYLISSSRATSIWQVLAAGQAVAGRTDVVTVLDSTVARNDSISRVETFYLAFTPDGDIYQYGFLARIAEERLQRSIPWTWDRIGAFSLGFQTSWLVGALDSAAQEPVYGSITGTEEMYSATVNGVQTVFRGYTIKLQGTSFAYRLRVSDAPSAFVEILEEPLPGTEGRYRELLEVTTASHAE